MSKSIFDSDKKIYCINCGNYGHKVKNCTEPVLSYGIITYRFINSKPEYLLIKRKDTIAYIQILTGKYDLSSNNDYILSLISELTENEKKKILCIDFETNWKKLWSKKEISKNNEFLNCKQKFNKFLEFIEQPEIKKKFNKQNWLETEWGIPKGRRNYKEKNLSTALREFNEETNIKLTDIKFYNYDVIEEKYKSNNNIWYKHVYYISEYIGNNIIGINQNNINQVKEVDDLNFFDIEGVKKKIRFYHKEKLNILINLDNKIKQNQILNR